MAAEQTERKHRTLNLFRKGLRLHANEPMRYALDTSDVVFPVYLMDIEWQREQEKFGVNKTKFMLECLKDLDTNLKAMGTRLFVIKGNALETIRKFCKE